MHPVTKPQINAPIERVEAISTVTNGSRYYPEKPTKANYFIIDIKMKRKATNKAKGSKLSCSKIETTVGRIILIALAHAFIACFLHSSTYNKNEPKNYSWPDHSFECKFAHVFGAVPCVFCWRGRGGGSEQGLGRGAALAGGGAL
jgi:hypothetical protein